MCRIVFTVCLFLVLNSGLVRSVSDDELDKLAEMCKGQEKATDADIKAWKDDVVPQTKVMKCLSACGLEKSGLLTNNMINVDASTKMIEMDVKDSKSVADLKKILDDCKSVTDADRCEAATKIIDCVNSSARKIGMKDIF